jgi:esterase/lipase superfamily enzyme
LITLEIEEIERNTIVAAIAKILNQLFNSPDKDGDVAAKKIELLESLKDIPEIKNLTPEEKQSLKVTFKGGRC